MAIPTHRLGKYEQLDWIAQDGDSALHRGIDPANGRAVLLRSVPLSAFVGQDERLARFRRDAGVAVRLIHPAIIPVYASGETDSVVFIASELVYGTSLDTLIDRLTDWTDRLTILRSVLDALCAAHRSDLTHGAISPAAIWLRADGTVGVSGFGMAALHHPNATQADDVRAAAALVKQLIADRGEHPAVAVMLARLNAASGGFSSIAALRDAVDSLDANKPRGAVRRPLAWRPLAVLLLIGLAVAAGFAWQRKIAKIRAVPVVTAPVPSPALSQPPETPKPETLAPPLLDAPSPPAPAEEPPPDLAPVSPEPIAPPPVQPMVEPPAASDEALNPPAPEPPTVAARPSVIEIRAALRSIPCALVAVTEEEERLVTSGAVAGEAARNAVQALLERVAEGREVRANVANAPDSLCAPLTLVVDALVANADQAAPMMINLVPRPLLPNTPLHSGDPLILDIAGPPHPTMLQVDYYTSDGAVVHLAPNPADGDARLEAAGERRLGERVGSSRFWSVGPPFGPELIVALATSKPLFADPRPESEPAPAYLTALKQAMAAQSSTPTALAVALVITTQP